MTTTAAPAPHLPALNFTIFLKRFVLKKKEQSLTSLDRIWLHFLKEIVFKNPIWREKKTDFEKKILLQEQSIKHLLAIWLHFFLHKYRKRVFCKESRGVIWLKAPMCILAPDLRRAQPSAGPKCTRCPGAEVSRKCLVAINCYSSLLKTWYS